MLKIPQHKRFNQLPEHIQDQLQPLPVYQIKFVIAGGTFLLLDAFVLIPLLFPYMKAFLYVILPLLAGISIWAIWLLCKKVEDIELDSVLFSGYLGVVGAISYFLMGLKCSYIGGIQSPIYYIVMCVLFLATVYFSILQQYKKYDSIEKRPKKNTPAWQYTLVRVSVPVGYIIAQYIMGLSPTLVLVVMTIVWYGFSYLFIWILAKSFHKYFFIKENIHLVYFVNKKLGRKARGAD